MPTRPPIHQPAGSKRRRKQVVTNYNRTPERRAHQQLYDWAWRQYSARRLQQYPYCVRCYAPPRKKITRAVVTDHIQPHKGDSLLFRDPSNHQSLCEVCHNKKTRKEDGGGGQAGRASSSQKPASRA